MQAINVSEIPEEHMNSLARTALMSIKDFFADAENMKRFEKWQAERCEKVV